MQLVERFWVAVTTFVSIITFSPFANEDHGYQLPMSNTDLDVVYNYGVSESSGPVFAPPGTEFYEGSLFKCDYSAMVGWEPCTSKDNRQCWLKKTDGSEEPFDIWTDYENRMPIGRTIEYDLDLRDWTWDADGREFKYAKLFAKGKGETPEYPGPWIQACWGDSLEKNGTSVHWHGLRMNQTMHMDGVNGVTQCPIAPGDYFVYNFTVTQYGSSWYHSHYSVQYADGAVGGMTLHGPSSANYDEAVSPPLIMTEWGNNSAFQALFVGLEDVDILLDGKGNIHRFNHSIANTTRIKDPFTVDFKKPASGSQSKKYLMRLINTSFQTTFVFTIDHHKFTVVEADFVPVKPFEVKSILVGIGQRYDIIVEADPIPYHDEGLPDSGNYWIRTYVADCFADTQPGDYGYERTGILRYQNITGDPTTLAWPNFRGQVKLDCVDTIKELDPVFEWTVDEPKKYITPANDIKFKSYPGTQAPYNFANFSLGPDFSDSLRVNYTNITFFNLDANGTWPSVWRVQTEDFPVVPGKTHWAYLAIQSKGSHPIHLHGHDFAVIQSGEGVDYDPTNRTFDLINPPRRDVILLPHGFVLIAFKADNPGAWLVHCHIAEHIAMGLGMQIMEDQEKAAQIWPTGNSSALHEAHRVCKNWSKWVDEQPEERVRHNCTSDNDRFDDTGICFHEDSGV